VPLLIYLLRVPTATVIGTSMVLTLVTMASATVMHAATNHQVDAVLSLIEMELPMWRPRRLIYDGGEWVCSLSRYPETPIELDDTADGRHHAPAVAMLLSLLEAKRLFVSGQSVEATSVPQVAPEPAAYSFCCDNFG